MPRYEYCDNCRREVAVTLSIGQHDKGDKGVLPVRRAAAKTVTPW